MDKGDALSTVIKYKNGCLLAYTDNGSRNSFPVLVQHGMIASIDDTCLFDHLLQTGARVISIARPGYGKSSPYMMKDMAEWGDIVSILVDELRISQFDVLGISSGAPYSYAIGNKLASRVRKLFILSGTPALYEDRIVSFWPYPIDKNAVLADLQDLARKLFFSNLSETDLLKNDIRDSMMNDCFGIAQDLRLRCKNWGFDLSQVKTNVYMQHCRMDSQVPFITAEMTCKMLPNCKFFEKDSGEHFSTEVLNDFIETVMAEKNGSA